MKIGLFKRARPRSSYWDRGERPLRPWKRLLIGLVAAGGVALCAQAMVKPYQQEWAYQKASDCEARRDSGQQDLCIGWERVTVVGRRTDERCSGGGVDANGQPETQSCRTDYYVGVQRPSGVEWLDTTEGIYDSAHSGDSATLRTFQGRAVELSLKGHSSNPSPFLEKLIPLLMGAWVLLGVLVWTAASGIPWALFGYAVSSVLTSLPAAVAISAVLFGGPVAAVVVTVLVVAGLLLTLMVVKRRRAAW
ncbi:hypothetical protein [Streptomyces sp. NPDC127190]|uniref:hypothetical protein n=1 Tax=unclassified Streptomyces TaxID=2593676 RepID=UPI00362F5713